MSLNSWFKHYNNAHEGQSIFNLWASNQPEVIAFYWTLLELVSRWELEESRGELQLNLSTLRAKLGMNAQRSRKLLLKIQETFKIEVLWISDESFKVSIPNWLELQERRGGKRESKFHQSSTESPTEARSKKKEDKIQKKDTDIVTSASATRLPVEKSLGSKIWDSYSQAFQNRYQVIPVRNAKTNSQCSQLASRLGEDAHAVIAFYLTHNDQWYLKRQHDLGSLLQAAESIHSQWQRGQAVTSAQVRTFEKQSGNMDLLEKVRKGEL